MEYDGWPSTYPKNMAISGKASNATVMLDFSRSSIPAAEQRIPMLSNDSGTVIGVYYDDDYNEHGFIWNNGQWASLGSELLGISNSNVVLGIGSSGWHHLFSIQGWELRRSPVSAQFFVDRV